MKYFVYLISIFLSLFFFSCKRKSEKITHDPQAKLSFSQSVLVFDTIFSSVGSITQRLWVYNDNSHALKISNIRLARLYNSSYTITINGQEELETSDYEIFGKDSLLILVKVLINPKNLSLPYLVSDSIVFTTNGNIQDVDLIAYGQDANFYTNTTVACNTTWTNIKPYVLSGNVTVPIGCTLTIDKGTRVRFHQGAKLIVEGTLITQGAKDSIVTFRHDNLSSYYNDVPGQWGGILFKSTSTNNIISYTEIKNATSGITMKEVVDGDTIPELILENSVLKNCSKNGITTTATDFYAVNSLLDNCVDYVFNASSGGNYYFDFCTLANYSYDFFRDSSIARFSNQDAGLSNPLLTRFRTSILWGDKTDEVVLNDNGTSGFTVTANYSIVKSNSLGTTIISNNSFNQDPLFTNESNKNFTLQTSSPAINTGIALPSIPLDLIGFTRDANPDKGCYEK